MKFCSISNVLPKLPQVFSFLRNQRIRLLSCLACAGLLACAAPRATPGLFDFGPLPVASTSYSFPGYASTLKVADIPANDGQDNSQMYYRLAYANAQQPQAYALSRWSLPPAQMLTQRVKTSLAQAGVRVLHASEAVTNVALLRIELDEFIHHFNQAQQSEARLRMRVSLIHGRALLAQKVISVKRPAISADAKGGALALALAADQAILEMQSWLASLPAAGTPPGNSTAR